MTIDIYAESTDLLERLANSIYDRDPNKFLFFSINEIQLVEKWLIDIIKHVRKDE